MLSKLFDAIAATSAIVNLSTCKIVVASSRFVNLDLQKITIFLKITTRFRHVLLYPKLVLCFSVGSAAWNGANFTSVFC